MELQQEILNELKAINARLTANASDWCTAKEACLIVGFFGNGGEWRLQKARRMGYLSKTRGGKGTVPTYYKPELYEFSMKLSREEIKI